MPGSPGADSIDRRWEHHLLRVIRPEARPAVCTFLAASAATHHTLQRAESFKQQCRESLRSVSTMGSDRAEEPSSTDVEQRPKQSDSVETLAVSVCLQGRPCSASASALSPLNLQLVQGSLAVSDSTLRVMLVRPTIACLESSFDEEAPNIVCSRCRQPRRSQHQPSQPSSRRRIPEEPQAHSQEQDQTQGQPWRTSTSAPATRRTSSTATSALSSWRGCAAAFYLTDLDVLTFDSSSIGHSPVGGRRLAVVSAPEMLPP